ncbi:Alpha-tubulin suppressor and related RCC1 domain-containing protein [Methanocella conradii HZ254]|uniref:Alpha-tubulin suppressor and related RCC1 domain-containing protein n=2 Tax=Methanocella TaxID=570266 RepID=H8I4N9_METCZ|nr:Alpha-tubulin suppressor and related RCC1 domain-containing protein [Methanocella conradii HZ254]
MTRKMLRLILVSVLLFTFVVPVNSASQKVEEISAGEFHNIVLCDDGTIWEWGNNSSGQLAESTDDTKYLLIHRLNMTGVKSVSAGMYHNLALKDDGTVWAWGYNRNGQLGDGTKITRSTPVQVNISNVTAIFAGGLDSFALKDDGTLWGWGANFYGQLGDGTNITRLSPVRIPIDNVKVVSSKGGSTIALKDDGTVWAWGCNIFAEDQEGRYQTGCLGVNSTDKFVLSPARVGGLDNVKDVDAGGTFTIALKNDGTVWAWGDGSQGQLGKGFKMNGPLDDPYQSTPIQVIGLSDIVDISAGDRHAMALKDDGTIWTWGYNMMGELGDGSYWNTKPSPVKVNLEDVIAISAGGMHSLALKKDGSVWAWGGNYYGEVGDGSTDDVKPLPLMIIGQGAHTPSTAAASPDAMGGVTGIIIIIITSIYMLREK